MIMIIQKLKNSLDLCIKIVAPPKVISFYKFIDQNKQIDHYKV